MVFSILDNGFRPFWSDLLLFYFGRPVNKDWWRQTHSLSFLMFQHEIIAFVTSIKCFSVKLANQ